ncbi:hypothetical protein HID58_003333 [Brassica napus]|uniref:Terpene synthase metal-binding domain-containing protein n=1 Tax=Brassica napus TaxID=3708 RepID=A0ABQ8EPT2_BRANA|nr:hypothetical protein HID58_003333 [Brassica napus]
MEASKMCFGLKTLPNVHNGPLCHNTNLSLIPCDLLQNNTLFSQKPTKHLLCVKAESSGDLESTRPLTYFPPSTWGDYFLSVPVDDSDFEALEQEIESVMKPKVRDILMRPYNSDKEKIRIIHLLISLAIAHYFESEIEEILHQAYQKLDELISEEGDLETIAIMFEVFRLYRHKMSCELPSSMRIIYQSVLKTVEDIDREMKARGKFGSLQPTIDETKSLMILYVALAKWAHAGHVPSFEDYMEIGISTPGLDDMAAYGFISMDDCDEKQLNEWFSSKPKIFEALNTAFRLRNDIVTFEQELSRGQVANGVNCYMKQHGVTKEAAVEVLRKMEPGNYKIMMEEFVSSKAMPRQILVRAVNIARVMDLYYKDGDGYSHPDQNLKDLIVSLFLCSIPL